jgi:AraC-like DNA-binding protein
VPFDRVAEAAATSLSLLILGRLSRLTCESYLVALTIRATNVLLANMGDIDRLWFLLHEPFLTDVSARLLHSAADTVAALPTRLRVGTVGIFAGSAIPRSALAFGTAIGANERMIQRWYVRVGLTGVAHVLSIARLALAWRRMRSHRLSLARVAKLAGYGSTRTLSRNCQIFAGGHAAVVREYTASELADRLSLHLLRGSAR